MLTKLRFMNQSLPESLSIDVGNPRRSRAGYYIPEIAGLGFMAANITSIKTPLIPGEIYTGFTTERRNIVFNIEFPSFLTNTMSVNERRNYVSRWFVPGSYLSEIALFYDNDTKYKRVISGYVESVQPEIFSKDPKVQVSILCVDPWFKPHPDDYIDLQIDTNSSGVGTFIFNYPGDVNTSANINVYKASSVSSLTRIDITRTSDSVLPISYTEYMRLDNTESPFTAFHMSSKKGSKFANANIGATTKNVIPKLTNTSKWLIITPGENKIEFLVQPNGVHHVEVDIIPLYSGV